MMKALFSFLLVWLTLVSNGQQRSFRFAFVSDTHIGSPNGSAEEDLRRTVRDINGMKDIAFVVITGDITELGTNEELQLAKQILDSLRVPWYIIPGNHDTGWSESGGMMFTTVFGNDKFSFEYAGIRFLGCASGPYVRMGDGHIPRDAINWLDRELKNLNQGQPLIFLNHYPNDNGLDNWYEVTDRLRQYNTWAVLCGHGHANRSMNFEDIAGVMGRSNLRARSGTGGYNLVDLRNDSLIFSERRPGLETLPAWTGLAIPSGPYTLNKRFTRPDFSVNDQYKWVREEWSISSAANIISTPLLVNEKVIVGNQQGEVLCVTLETGLKKWSFQAEGPIYSSPASYRGSVVFGSADGYVYCLDARSGKLKWKVQTGAPVLGCPTIIDKHVYIGGSKKFFSLDAANGKVSWSYPIDGPVVSTPVAYEGTIIFGAWDTYLYALNRGDGQLKWKWNNGSPVRNYSPAACIPGIIAGTIYLVAPDRYISAIDAATGNTFWRNNDATVRESIGFSEDGKWIYGKTMQDTIVAYAASREKQSAAWKMHCGFGYEHVPSMLIEKEGLVFFGTKNGVVYCIDPSTRKIIWAHKIDNSMVNTVRVLDKHSVLATTMDGKLVLLNAPAFQ